MQDRMLLTFRGAYGNGVSLCLVLACPVMGSLFLANISLPDGRAVIVSSVVSATFVVVGVLILGIGRQLSHASILGESVDCDKADLLRRSLRGLLIRMILALVFLDTLLATAVVSVLDRIGQGFAMFR